MRGYIPQRGGGTGCDYVNTLKNAVLCGNIIPARALSKN